MKRGKQTCKILKEIRRQIAEANDIEIIISECQYQGDCLGTCPKCESEVLYLEQQLERKRLAGNAIKILGISAGLVTMGSITSCGSTSNKETSQNPTSDTIATITHKDTICDILEGDVAIEKEDTLQMPIKKKQPARLEQVIVVEGEITEPETKDEKINISRHPEAILGRAPSKESELKVPDDTLEVAKVMPQFPGGLKEMQLFISKNLKNPKELSKEDIKTQSRVIIQFIINKEGDIIHPKVVRGNNPYLNKEALRVVALMPKWKPGESTHGTIVSVKYTLPITFRVE